MLRGTRAPIVAAFVLALAAFASAAGASELAPVSVEVASPPSIGRDVGIAFHQRAALPSGGYYYAVLVLTGYRSNGAPACATSSDMKRAQYAYPRAHHAVRLALAPASSASGHWCPGGTYVGAVYAVPHRPRCRGSEPCYGYRTQSGSCWDVEGRLVCGTVIGPPPYSYPGGLPKPIDRSARIVGRFQVRFPGAPPG